MKQRNVSPSPLQRDLLPAIMAMIRADALQPGAKLVELSFAARLGVSRTPVRAALTHLAEAGIARRAPRGFTLARLPPDAAPVAATEPTEAVDRLSLVITRDWMAGLLPADISESDLMRRTGAARVLLQRSLTQLTQLGVVERKRGHGWRFMPAITDLAARTESYRFRMITETAALLEPGYALDPAWVADMRQQHRTTLETPWRDLSSIAYYEMNAAFHEGIVAGAHNRFLLLAIQQQNQLRRVSNYDWSFARSATVVAARVAASCTQHLQILDAAEAGTMEVAAALMRLHLQQAHALR
jgi:DNA-binding GntR family transcriptional regulator